MKKNSKERFSRVKKSLHGFIKDEAGYVSKENILKIGLGVISTLGVLGAMSNAYAGHASHPSHANSLAPNVVHNSVATHASHNHY